MAMHVLLADEDRDLCWLLSQSLAPAGVELTTVHDGEAALQALAAQAFAALILNLTLPQPTSFEVLHQVRNRDAELPIVVISAVDSEIMRHKALALGANHYLTKPFQHAQLIEALTPPRPAAAPSEASS
jgi:DNA-binding response OmpR family regulator